MKLYFTILIVLFSIVFSCTSEDSQSINAANKDLNTDTSYFENGNIKFIGHLNSKGEREGMWREFTIEGKLIWKGIYHKNERYYPIDLANKNVITYQVGDTIFKKGKISMVQIECEWIHPEDIVIEVSNAKYNVVNSENSLKTVYIIPTSDKDVLVGAFFPIQMGMYCKLSVRPYKVNN
jgi:hypothetical protein